MHSGTGLASTWESGLADRKHRQLALAVLASLALHALILFSLSSYKEFTQARAAPPPLTARLAKAEAAPQETPKIEPRPPASLPASRPASAVKPLAPQPAFVPIPAVPVASVEPAKPAAEPTLVAPAAAPQSGARADAPPALAAASGPDPGSVARFRLELMEIARRYKRYPRIAQDNNWEGRVELRLAFSESGALASLDVKKSAGRAVLDEEAQAMIRSAQPQASIPPALRGKAFTLEIPVDFYLKDEGR